MTVRVAGLAAAALLLLPLLAGCSSPTPAVGSSGALVAALHWPTLTVKTTASEPAEQSGPIQVSWSAGWTASTGLFAVWSALEPDLNRKTVVAAGTAYVTDRDVGWTSLDLETGIQTNRLSARLTLWDLPRILASPGITLRTNVTGNVLNVTADGTIAFGMEVHLQVGAVDNQVVWAREMAPNGREAPFTFRADGAPFPFPVAKPAVSKPSAEVSQLNDDEHAAHTQVIKLLQAYARNHGNTVPDTPSASSLALELTAAGQSWPNNAFTGQPLAVGPGPGDIRWAKCSLSDATYAGRGWDGLLVSQGFNLGCRGS